MSSLRRFNSRIYCALFRPPALAELAGLTKYIEQTRATTNSQRGKRHGTVFATESSESVCQVPGFCDSANVGMRTLRGFEFPLYSCAIKCMFIQFCACNRTVISGHETLRIMFPPRARFSFPTGLIYIAGLALTRDTIHVPWASNGPA